MIFGGGFEVLCLCCMGFFSVVSSRSRGMKLVMLMSRKIIC